MLGKKLGGCPHTAWFILGCPWGCHTIADEMLCSSHPTLTSDDWRENVGMKMAESCLLQARIVLMEKWLTTVCDIFLLDMLRLYITISCECSFGSNRCLVCIDPYHIVGHVWDYPHHIPMKSPLMLMKPGISEQNSSLRRGPRCLAKRRWPHFSAVNDDLSLL